jgi:putative salt-induced outer membrane protein
MSAGTRIAPPFWRPVSTRYTRAPRNARDGAHVRARARTCLTPEPWASITVIPQWHRQEKFVKRRIAAVVVLATTALGAQAGDFTGQAALGYLETEGNAHSKSLNAKSDLIYTQDPWKNDLTLAAINTSGSTPAERYDAADKLDYGFTPRDYAFGELEWEKDLTGATRQRTAESAGYGRHVLTGPTHILDLEVGAGLRQEELNVTREHQNEAIARVGGKYQWNITDVTHLIWAVKSELGHDNTYTESATELHMPVAGALSAVLSYTVRANSHVEPGVHHTDTATSAALAYTFGKPPG